MSMRDVLATSAMTVAIALGLVAIFVYWKRFHTPPANAPASSEPAIDEKYRKRIEAEMADLD